MPQQRCDSACSSVASLTLCIFRHILCLGWLYGSGIGSCSCWREQSSRMVCLPEIYNEYTKYLSSSCAGRLCVCLDTCWITVFHPMYASKVCKISPQLSFLFLEKLPDASLLFCKTSCILPICFPPCFSGGKWNVGARFKYSLNILDRLEVKSKSISLHRAEGRNLSDVQPGWLNSVWWWGLQGPHCHHRLEWKLLGGSGLLGKG